MERSLGMALALALIGCTNPKGDSTLTTGAPTPGTPVGLPSTGTPSTGTPGGTPSTGTPTGTPSTGTPTGTTPPVEDCTDGVENDGDGLLDCEDPDCAADPACLEGDCTDGVDNDADGFLDCEDGDCWATADCGVTVARTQGAAAVSLRHRDLRRGHFVDPNGPGTATCSSSFSSEYGTLTLDQPYGTLTVYPAGATTWTTCQWSASSSMVRADDLSGFLGAPALPVQRAGLVIDPGCPVQDPSVFPAEWTVDGTVGGRVVLNGPPLAAGTRTLWTAAPQLTYQPYFFGSGSPGDGQCVFSFSYNGFDAGYGFGAGSGHVATP